VEPLELARTTIVSAVNSTLLAEFEVALDR